MCIFTGRIYFFIEKIGKIYQATRCEIMSTPEFDIKDVKPEYKKYYKAGMLPYLNEDELIIQKDTFKELERYLCDNYPNYRCQYYNISGKDRR